MPHSIPKTTKNLKFPLLEENAPGQTPSLNGSLALLDLMSGSPPQLEDKDLTTPPALTGSLNGYLVPSGASGAWSTKAKKIAWDINSAWVYVDQADGMTVYLKDENIEYKSDGTNWAPKTTQVTTALTLTGVTKTSNFTASVSEAAVYEVDASSGSITITLPAAASCATRAFYFVRTDANANRTVTLDPNGSETISGATTFSITSQHMCVLVWSNGTNWRIL